MTLAEHYGPVAVAIYRKYMDGHYSREEAMLRLEVTQRISNRRAAALLDERSP